MDISRLSIPRSDACALHMTGMRRVRTGWRQLVFASVSRVRPSREIPAKQSVLLNCHFWFTLSVPTLYITHKCICGYSERKTLREVYTIHPPIRESYPFLERNLCSLFSFLLPLLYLLRGNFYLNTTHTYSKCWECFWCCWEALEDAKDGGYNMELVAGSGKLEKTKVQHNFVGTRNLKGLDTLGILGLEGFLLFMYPNFIL